MAAEANSGIIKLANTLIGRMRRENETPLILDFGEIQNNYSLVTNTFPKPVPKGDYSICRQLTLGKTGDKLADIKSADNQETNVGEGNFNAKNVNDGEMVAIPENMRSVEPGDRVLVAWVQNEAVVIDIISSS